MSENEDIENSSIDLLVPACFIERDDYVPERVKVLINQWLAGRSPADRPRRYEQYIGAEVVAASEHPGEVWRAILASGHIWCSSAFVGESAGLFMDLLMRADDEGVSNKIVFNLADRSESVFHLHQGFRQAGELMQELERSRNIRFLFREDLYGVHARHRI